MSSLQMEYESFSEKTSSFLTDQQIKRTRTRCRMALQLMERVLHGVFEEQKSADGVLTSCFRMDHRIGSRDRKFYSALIFALLRWYGPLRRAFAARKDFLTFYAAALCMAEGFEAEAKIFLEDLDMDPDTAFAKETIRLKLDSFLTFCGESDISDQELFGELFFENIPFVPDRSFLEKMQTRPTLWLRCRSGCKEKVMTFLRDLGFPVEEHPLVKDALAVTGEKRLNLQELSLYKNGMMEVQDLSSQAIALCCPVRKGDRWWDCCAGGGGKTLLLGSLLQQSGGGSVTSSDIREWKLTELLRRAKRAHLRNVSTCVWNGEVVEENMREHFDGVLVDAPCSSSGRWRRNPEGRFLLREKDLADVASLQYSILCHAAQAVKKGGVLLYGTCSFFQRENEENVKRFLAEYEDFELEAFPHPLNGKKTNGMMRVIPSEELDCDGSFAARFRRK